MADPVSDERFLELLITNPEWCLFYHRSKVKALLPSMTKAYILVRDLQVEITERVEKVKAEEEHSILEAHRKS